jgi:hypothetical protein
MRQGCSSTCSLPGTELSFHLQNCKTYCSKCFYSQVCRAGKSKHSQYCRLKQNPKNRYFIPNFPNTTGKVCQLCVKRDSKEQQSRREARDRAEIERLTQQSLACSHCKVSIPMKGPRWWVCSECASECRHHIHPPWARKMEV